MIAYKHINRIVTAIVAFTVLLCILAMGFSGQLLASADTGVSMQYESELFDTSEPLSINILIEESDWEEMLANAIQETYYQCDVEINGTTFYSVGIRPKGNTSLTTIASDPDTDRYSLKLEFDHYMEDQTCYGLDKLILNNNYADATNMKEALIYDMFQYLGADASLYNYASISVNGEYWGVYLALEGVEDSFLLRNYGVESGELYKPENMDMGGAQDGGDGAQGGGNDVPGSGNDAQGGENAAPGGGNGAQGNGGGLSMSSGGSDLTYTDDDPDSYSTIWDGEVSNTSDSDHERVITALKNISEGTDLEDYMDIDNLLRYAAVHMFSVNEDSLSGAMAHNYYLYESNGKLNLIPWDYNLALGGMNGTNATDMVNDPIDDIFTGTTFFDTLMENEEYLAQYHAYLGQLVEEYINGGAFDEFYERTRSQIDSLVEADPTAFYSYEEYQTAADYFYQAVKLRGQSIEGQLDGSIPSTASGQQEDDSALIDASAIDLSAMGTMSAGGGGGDFGGGNAGEAPGNGPGGANAGGEDQSAMSDPPQGFDSSTPPDGFDPSNAPGNGDTATPPEAVTESSETEPRGTEAQAAEPSEMESSVTGSSETESPDTESPDTGSSETAPSGAGSPDSGAFPSNFDPTQNGQGGPGDFDPESFSGSSAGQDSTVTENLLLFGICFAILLAALIFALLFKRKPRRRL